MSAQPLAAEAGWSAELRLTFAPSAERSVPRERWHRGPLTVQRPFYPEGEVCHVYLLHPPGGVVGGDRLDIRVRSLTGAHALVTTPAATKFYRSAGPLARQTQSLYVAPGATLEWLPQETLLFGGCEVETTTRIELEGDARFIGWEVLVLGRRATGDAYAAGRCRSAFELWRDGAPLLIERSRFVAGDPMLAGDWGLAGHPVSASMMITGVDRSLTARMRETVVVGAAERLGVTLLGDVLACRYLGAQPERAREVFASIWTLVRPEVLGRPACAPRIWNT